MSLVNRFCVLDVRKGTKFGIKFVVRAQPSSHVTADDETIMDVQRLALSCNFPFRSFAKPFIFFPNITNPKIFHSFLK